MIWLIAAATYIIDQISKYLAKGYLKPRGSLPVIDGVFHLTYVENRGVAFGMLQNRGWIFIPVTLIIALAIIFILIKTREERLLYRLPLAIILGGALGNLSDRLLRGFVVDFFDFRIWPVFNIADSAIVVGAILLSYFVLFKGVSFENGKN